jgi:hypothetical protein
MGTKWRKGGTEGEKDGGVEIKPHKDSFCFRNFFFSVSIYLF